MRLATYLDQLSADGALLAATAEEVPLDAEVRSCPGWTVRDLITHVGGIHRWAASIVGNAMLDNDEVTGDQVGMGPDDATLVAWFREGHQALLQTLRGAASDLRCFTFLPAPTPLLFWARRQAHETAIHRVDAQTVTGEISALDADFARDGIEEILFGFAARPRPAIEPGMMLVKPDDLSTAWLLTFGDTGVTTSVGDGDADVDTVLTGSADDLYRWLWNRPSAAVLSGDKSVADRWRGVRVRWS